MELKNTQEDLLKTLKKLYDLKSPPRIEITGPFKDLTEDLDSIKQNLDLFKPNKYVSSDKESFFYNLPKIHQYLNDVSGVNMDFKYGNNYKMNPLIKLNINSLNNIDSLLQDLKTHIEFYKQKKESINIDALNIIPNKINTNFEEKREKINLNLASPDKVNTDFLEKREKINLNLASPEKFNTNFLEERKKINLNLDNIKPHKLDDDIILRKEKINLNLHNHISDIKNFDFTTKSLPILDTKLISDKILKIKEELQELTKLLAKIKLTALNFSNYTSDKYLNNIKHYVDQFVIIEASTFSEKAQLPDFNQKLQFNEATLDKKTIEINRHNFYLYDKDENLPQVGGGHPPYLDTSTEYINLLRDKDYIIKELKENINKNNLNYIHYYYFQLFILKKINNLPKEIYQFVSKSTLLTYCEILNRLNQIISDPEKILNNSTNANLYFKYFIIIKILFVFFNSIKNKWTSHSSIPDNFKISVFHYEITSNSNIGIKEISKYFLLFNLVYPILDRFKINK